MRPTKAVALGHRVDKLAGRGEWDRVVAILRGNKPVQYETWTLLDSCLRAGRSVWVRVNAAARPGCIPSMHWSEWRETIQSIIDISGDKTIGPGCPWPTLDALLAFVGEVFDGDEEKLMRVYLGLVTDMVRAKSWAQACTVLAHVRGPPCWDYDDNDNAVLQSVFQASCDADTPELRRFATAYLNVRYPASFIGVKPVAENAVGFLPAKRARTE